MSTKTDTGLPAPQICIFIDTLYDWGGIYLDGRLLMENHSHQLESISELKLLLSQCDIKLSDLSLADVDIAYISVNWCALPKCRLPERLEDLMRFLEGGHLESEEDESGYL